MAVCTWCDQEMTDHVPCTGIPEVRIGGRLLPRVPYPTDIDMAVPWNRNCRDCATPPGQLHHPGCDKERCPSCGGQGISCGCRWDDYPGSDENDEPIEEVLPLIGRSVTLAEYDPNIDYPHGTTLPTGWQEKFDRYYRGDHAQIQGSITGTFTSCSIWTGSYADGIGLAANMIRAEHERQLALQKSLLAAGQREKAIERYGFSLDSLTVLERAVRAEADR